MPLVAWSVMVVTDTAVYQLLPPPKAACVNTPKHIFLSVQMFLRIASAASFVIARQRASGTL